MADDYKRYAIYFAPAPASPLGEFGNAWLGRDPKTGNNLARPVLDQIGEDEIARWTTSPSRYGFHGTLKPPFVLADDTRRIDLEEQLSTFAAKQKALTLAPLKLARIGRFLVLAPTGGRDEIAALAAGCVQEFDNFRAPPSATELERRRMARLSPRQEELLATWGYPYVMEEFRFHLTLSNSLDDESLDRLIPGLEATCGDILATPFIINDICLFGDPGDNAPFTLLRRFPFTG